MILALLNGVLAGSICIGGLFFGIRLLLGAQKLSKDEFQKKALFNSLASLILVGQLFLAGYVLVGLPFFFQNPLAGAIGLIFSIFLGNNFARFK